LEKDRARRVADINTARFLLIEPIALGSAENVSGARSGDFTWRRRWQPTVPAMAYAIVVGVIAGASAWVLRPPNPRTGVTRFSFHLPPNQQFTNAGRNLVALSTDGTKTAYVANGHLYLKEVDRFDPVAIAGAEGGASGVTTPTFSPDGRFIAFWSGGDATLKKV